MPLISVIVPCYNQAQYLDECLQSVLDQTYTDWECIIVNDGSPDNTEDVAKKWVEKDARFRYLFKENGGLSSARNAGIEIAKGEWILPLDADDKIGNQYLELAEKEFEKDYTVIYCTTKFFGAKQGEWKLADFSLNTLAKFNILTCTSFYKKDNWEKVGGYDKNFIFGLEDYDFWISILKNGGKVHKIENPLFFYRIKKNSMIKNLINENKTKMFDLLSIKHADFFVKHLGNFNHIYIEKEEIAKKITFYQSSKRYKFIDKILSPIDYILKRLK